MFPWREIRNTKKPQLAVQVVSLMKNEQQSRNLLLKVDLRSTFCNNFLEPATNVLLRDKLVMQDVKEKHEPKLATKQCCTTS